MSGDEPVVIRATAPKIVVRSVERADSDGYAYTGWNVWMGRRVVQRHDLKHLAVAAARELADRDGKERLARAAAQSNQPISPFQTRRSRYRR